MPYYQNPTWGDMIAQAGAALQGYLIQREEEAVNRLKNRYGTNIEAWRQDAMRNPNGEEAKYYKKFVGDPNAALPEDPQVAQQRERMEVYKRLREQIDPKHQPILDANMLGLSGEMLSKMIQQNPQASSLDIAQRRDKYMELYPNATPQQWQEMATADVTGNNPYTAKYTPQQMPVDTSPQGWRSPYSIFTPQAYDVEAVESTPAEVMAKMGETKQQIKLEDVAQRRKMTQDKFDNLKENQKRIDERFNKTFNRLQAQWKEGQKYKMTPEERIQFNATVSALNRRAANLYKQKNTAGNEVKKLESEVSSLKAGKAMMGDVGGEYAKSIDQQITDTTNRLDAAKKAQEDIDTQIDAIESEIPVYGSVTAAPDAGGAAGGSTTSGKNDFLRIQGK